MGISKGRAPSGATAKGAEKKSFIRNTGVLAGTSVFNAAVSLLPTYFVLRILSVTDYGKVKLLLLVLSFTILSEVGVAKAVRRIYPTMLARNAKQEQQQTVGVGLVFIMFTGLVLCAALLAAFALGFRLENSLSGFLAGVLCVQILAEKAYRYLQIVLISEARFKDVSLLRLAGALLGLMVIPGVYFWGCEGYFAATALGLLMLVAVGWTMVGGQLKPAWSWPALKPLLRKGCGFLLINIQNKVFNRLELILIPIFLPLRELAVYSVAFQAANTVGKLYNSLSELLLQRIARDRGKSGTDQNRYLEAYLGPNSVVLYFSLFLLMPLLYFAVKPLVLILLPKYVRSLEVLKVLTVAYAFYRAGGLPRLVLMVMGKVRALNALTLSSLGMNLVLDVCLIQLMGLMGLAWGTLISFTVSFIVAILMVNHLAQRQRWQGVKMALRILLVGAFSLALVMALDWGGDLFAPILDGLGPRPVSALSVMLMQSAAYLLLLLPAFCFLFRDEDFWYNLKQWLKAATQRTGNNAAPSR